MIRPKKCPIFKTQHCSGGGELSFSSTGLFTKKASERKTEYVLSYFPLSSNYFLAMIVAIKLIKKTS